MKNLDKIIAESEKSLKQLNEKMHEFDEIVNILRKLKEAPEEMQILLEEVLLKAKSYTEDINKITNNYLLASNETIFNNLNELSLCNKNLQTEIDRLIGTDFSMMFKNLEQDFVSTVSHQFEIELAKVFEITDVFQSKIDLLQTEISRLEEVDLDKGFDELHDSLAKMYQSINNVNLTLVGFGDNFFKVIAEFKQIKDELLILNKSAERLELGLNSGLLKTNESIRTNSDITIEVDKKVDNIVELLTAQITKQQGEFALLSRQNENINKQLAMIKLIIASGLILSIVAIGIMIVKIM